MIKPLLFATEKVVEYYFSEEQKKEEQKQSQSTEQTSKSNGNATKTTVDTLSDSSNELRLIKNRL